MKPRHQLSRTPPKKLEKPLETENTIQPQQHFKSTQEVMIISPLRNQGMLIFLTVLVKNCTIYETIFYMQI